MHQFTQEQLSEALQVLESGGVIVYPTETSYGIGCDATNAEAVARVFQIKGRPEGKGLPVLIPDTVEAPNYVEMSAQAVELASRYWPGDLNIVAPVADGSAIAEQCNQEGAQSVRVSSHPFAATLTRRFGKPIVATSANVSGEEALYDAKSVKELFAGRENQPDLVVNGGSLVERPASTTVRIDGDDVQILRQGSVEI